MAEEDVHRVPQGGGISVPGGAARSLVDRDSGAIVSLEEPLSWRPVAPMAREFELSQGDLILGELGPSLGEQSVAWGECFGDAWEIDATVRFWGGRINAELRRNESGEKGLSYEGRTLAWGTIRTAAGETLRWRKPFLGNESHQLFAAGREVLLRMRPARMAWSLTSDTTVRLTHSGAKRDDVTQLLLMTCFLRVQAAAAFHKPFKMRSV